MPLGLLPVSHALLGSDALVAADVEVQSLVGNWPVRRGASRRPVGTDGGALAVAHPVHLRQRASAINLLSTVRASAANMLALYRPPQCLAQDRTKRRPSGWRCCRPSSRPRLSCAPSWSSPATTLTSWGSTTATTQGPRREVHHRALQSARGHRPPDRAEIERLLATFLAQKHPQLHQHLSGARDASPVETSQ